MLVRLGSPEFSERFAVRAARRVELAIGEPERFICVKAGTDFCRLAV